MKFKKSVLSSRELKIKRLALYQTLENILEKTASELELIVPVAQFYDPDFQHAKKKYRKPGFCFGYSQVWHANISKNYNADPYPQNCSDFDQEPSNPSAPSWPVFPLTEQIADIQKRQSYDANHSEKYKSAKYFKNTKLLLNHLENYLKKLKEIDLNTESTPETSRHIVINLAPLVKLDIHTVVLAAWTRYSPRHLKKWHDVRIYIDPLDRIHWFDSNIGWFRTRQSHPDPSDFCADLYEIFELLNYSKYSVIATYQPLQMFALESECASNDVSQPDIKNSDSQCTLI